MKSEVRRWKTKKNVVTSKEGAELVGCKIGRRVNDRKKTGQRNI